MAQSSTAKFSYGLMAAAGDLFTRRFGLDRQGMHAIFKFTRQKMIDGTVAVDAALSSKSFRNQFDAKVGFACGPGGSAPRHGVGVARMLMGFVDDLDGGRGQSRL